MPAGVSAYVALANATLGSSAASVTFSSISGSYRDLIMVCNFTPDFDSLVSIRINGDTGSNYNRVFMQGNGTSATSAVGTTTRLYISSTLNMGAGQRANLISNFMDYSATDKHKIILNRLDSAANGTIANAGRWANTSAITSIYVDTDGGTFAAGSTFALYGVSA